jgi:hypothetical protein
MADLHPALRRNLATRHAIFLATSHHFRIIAFLDAAQQVENMSVAKADKGEPCLHH